MRPVAVVTIAHGRHDHLDRQVESLAAGTRRLDHVVVAMGDPELAARAVTRASHVVPLEAQADALPLAAARNLGAHEALARGAETLVFLDVDCLAGPDLVDAYDRAVVSSPGTIWSGPVTYLPPGRHPLDRLAELDDPHPVRPAPAPGELVRPADPDLFWSLSFAIGREDWLRSGGFCEEYVGYGGEDTDFGRSFTERGLAFAWLGSARAYHQHHTTQDPPAQHVRDIVRNAAIFHRRWGAWPMLGWLEAFEEQGLVRRTVSGWEETGAPAARAGQAV